MSIHRPVKFIEEPLPDILTYNLSSQKGLGYVFSVGIVLCFIFNSKRVRTILLCEVFTSVSTTGIYWKQLSSTMRSLLSYSVNGVLLSPDLPSP